MQGFQSLRDQLPFDFYEEVRAEGRPVWDEGMRGWLIVSNSGCRRIEMMEETHFTPEWYDTPPEVVRVARGSESALAAGRGDEPQAALEPMVAAGGGDIASAWLDRLPLRLFLRLIGLELPPEEFEACWTD